MRREILTSLEQYDYLISPVAATPAYKLGEKSSDPLAMYKGDLMTVNINLAGVPAISLPCGFTEADGVQLPVGLQIIGRPFGEEGLLRVAHTFE